MRFSSMNVTSDHLACISSDLLQVCCLTNIDMEHELIEHGFAGSQARLQIVELLVLILFYQWY